MKHRQINILPCDAQPLLRVLLLWVSDSRKLEAAICFVHLCSSLSIVSAKDSSLQLFRWIHDGKTLCIESLLANIPGCARTWRHATCYNARSWKVQIALNLFSCPNVVSLLALPLSLSKTTRAWRCCPECIKLFRSFLLLIPPFVFLQIAAAAGEMEVTVLPFADSEQRRYETVVYCTPICHRLLTLLPLLGKASLFKLPLCSLH